MVPGRAPGRHQVYHNGAFWVVSRGLYLRNKFGSALLVRLSALNRVGYQLSEEMIRHRLTSLLPNPIYFHLAAATQALAMEEYVVLVDRVHEAHIESLPQQCAPICLYGISNAAPTGSPRPSAEALALHVLQQQAAVGAGASRDLSLAALSCSSEAQLAWVEATLRHLEVALARPPAQMDAQLLTAIVPRVAVTRPHPLGGPLLSAGKSVVPGKLGPSLPSPRPQSTDCMASALPAHLRPLASHALPATVSWVAVLCFSPPACPCRRADFALGPRFLPHPALLRRRLNPRTQSAYYLLTGNRTVIATYGTQTHRLAFFPCTCFSCAFVVADVEQAILGIDFLAIHDLLVDTRRRCLLHQPSATVIDVEPCAQPTLYLITLRQATQFEALLQEFPLLTSQSSGTARYCDEDEIRLVQPRCSCAPDTTKVWSWPPGFRDHVIQLTLTLASLSFVS
ncbi:hypothetical protein E2C01_033364 [Portunus trituberculatus]|uniref:Uncharacterized protein n=1 Tax=Portunus trituberculatus TaxID=210409 RepID=A0A5B7F288_PORTR|nr:hypothetical protein [Portunus trituberculatus]